jgi:stage IV sporulation protein B
MKKIAQRERAGKIRGLAMAMAVIISVMTPMAYAGAAQEKLLVPMGCTVGIQIQTDGVMVVGLSATENGASPSPAAVAGIAAGDIITALGGEKIGCADDFRRALEKLVGGAVSITVARGEETHQLTIEPNMTGGAPELGVWLRDSISGIGTITYYDPQTGQYGGLGHSINDVDSGVIMPLGKGHIMSSSVSSIVKGCVGSPGELCGTFDPGGICGTIVKNTGSGIFGELNPEKPPDGKAIPMGREADIYLGKASVLANISGTDIGEYEIEIVRIYRNDDANRSMMIKVTDASLIAQTGGIVQGMSGSPIIQDGKLVGAVTHVMINDPTSGFAVTAEKMLETSQT